MEFLGNMSKEAPVGLPIMEKLMGLLIIAVGGLWFYVTYTNMGNTESLFVIFLGLAVALMALGVVLLISKFD